MSHASLRREARRNHDAKVGRYTTGGKVTKGFVKAEVKRGIREHETQEHGGKHSRLKLRTGGVAGDRPKPRLDRRGKKGAKGTHVNVIVAPGTHDRPVPVPVARPNVGPPAPPMAPPGAPVGVPPGGMPMRPPMGMPPGGIPMRARGGRIDKAGAGSGEGRLEKLKAYGKKKTGEGVRSVAPSKDTAA